MNYSEYQAIENAMRDLQEAYEEPSRFKKEELIEKVYMDLREAFGVNFGFYQLDGNVARGSDYDE